MKAVDESRVFIDEENPRVGIRNVATALMGGYVDLSNCSKLPQA